MNPKNRNAQLHIRINDKLKEQINERAKELDMTIGDYVIQCLSHNRIVNLKGIRDVLNQLLKIGVNINQIAEKANSIRYISQEDIKKTKQLMENCFIVVENFIELNSKNSESVNENSDMTLNLILEKIKNLEDINKRCLDGILQNNPKAN